MNNVKSVFISFLISSSIFFWDIEYGNLKFETLIILLLFTLNKIDYFIDSLKKVRIFYILFLQTFLLDIFHQDEFILETYYKLIYLFLLEIIIIRKLNFISTNLPKIVTIFLIIFLCYTFGFLYKPENYCLGCFSVYKKFYTENSHLGMIAPSIIIFGFFYILKNKAFIFGILYIFFFLILYHNLSSTLFIGALISIFFIVVVSYTNLNLKIFISYLSIIFILILLIVKPEFKQMLNNKLLKNKIIDTSLNLNDEINVKKNDEKNYDEKKYNLSKYKLSLSLEVYVKSLLTSYEILKDNLFGIGFDKYRLNLKNDLFEFRYIISGKLNNQDASQNFSKGFSEIGILFIYIFYIIFVFTKSKTIPIYLKNFFIPILIVQLFVRGAGYFNGGFLLSFLFIFHYYYLSKNSKMS